MSTVNFSDIVLLTQSENLTDFSDWVDWHLNVIGFDHIHVIDNDSLVDIKPICQSYGSRISYATVSGQAHQYDLYAEYVNSCNSTWVLPIDDDEFLYVSDRYGHNVNELLNILCETQHASWHKLCIGWRCLLPAEFIEQRTNAHMVLNANCWYDAPKPLISENRTIKTFCKTTVKYKWGIFNHINHYHNPAVINSDEPGYTISGEPIHGSMQAVPTQTGIDSTIYHYKYKCNNEWINKCKTRVPGNPNQYYIDGYDSRAYRQIYASRDFSASNIDNSVIDLWNKYKNKPSH